MEEIFKPDFSNINIDHKIPTISISSILGMLEKPFDREGVAQKTYDKHHNNPESEYYQMTIEQILEKWEFLHVFSIQYSVIQLYSVPCILYPFFKNRN